MKLARNELYTNVMGFSTELVYMIPGEQGGIMISYVCYIDALRIIPNQ
jgi:hypothetical protein